MPANGALTFAPGLSGQNITLTSGPINISRNLSIHQTAGSNINILGANNFPIFNITKDIQLSLRNINLYPSNGIMGRAINNEGILTLDNTHIFESTLNLGSGSTINNFGVINILGTSGIKAY
jgi:hypothetical protein